MLPQVTFIIPCYNEVNYISGCVHSIYNQSCDKDIYEIIVVDNGSTDGTQDVAASLGAKVITNSRRGASASRNLGARYARGVFLAFVDADCILDPLWLNKLSAYFVDPEVVATAAPAIPPLSGISWVESAWSKLFVLPAVRGLNGVSTVSNLASSNLLIDRKHFELSGGFDENLLSCEDYDLSQRLSSYGNLLLDANIHVFHLRESKTMMELIKREIVRGRYSLRCFTKNGYSLRELPSAVIPLINLILSVYIITTIMLGKHLPILQIILLILLAPSIYILKGGFKIRSIKCMLTEYLIAASYAFARCVALLYELYDLLVLNAKSHER